MNRSIFKLLLFQLQDRELVTLPYTSRVAQELRNQDLSLTKYFSKYNQVETPLLNFNYNSDIEKLRTKCNNNEIHFSMVNNFYLPNDLLKVRFVSDHNNCPFHETETTDCLFFHCSLWNFWSYRSDYKPNTKLTLFTRENIVFMDTEETKWDLLLNNLIHF